MEDQGNYINDDEASNVSFEVGERGVPILTLNMSHVTEEDSDVEEVYNDDNNNNNNNNSHDDHVSPSPSVEVVSDKQSTMEDPEVNDNTSNDNKSVEVSVNDYDGPGGPDIATASSRSKRKKCALALITSLALLALVVGLSAGLAGKNNDAQERSTSTSAAVSALTLEDCLAEAPKARGDEFAPTTMPTGSSDFPTYDSASEDSGEGDESSKEEGPQRVSNDFDIDLVVRRDLRGRNMKRSPTAIKAKEHSSALKSRRLQCDELIANQTP